MRFGDPGEAERPGPSVTRAWLDELDRVGRLVAAGPTSDPAGHLLVVRATELAEARRLLRADPFVVPEADETRLLAWAVAETGAGVNLEPPPARGAGRLTALHRISVFVRDQAAATAWYREVLGLTVRQEDPETEFVELSLGPGAAGLTLVRPRPTWGEPYYAEASARVGQRTGIAFRTDSVEALALRLQHAGARIPQPTRPEPWGGRSIRFADPDGNEFLAFDNGPREARAGPPRPPKRRHRRREA